MAHRITSRRFFGRPTLDVARDLLGKVLVHRRGATVSSGMIVEVEAYIGESDPACHAAPGPTPRNAPLYGPPGYAYVYLNYGLHYLVNVVTEAEGSPAAVLIRALEPLDGLTTMQRRRRGAKPERLCSGPGNVTKALGITLAQNRVDLLGTRLYLEDRGVRPRKVNWGPRIGITRGVERPWRAWIDGNGAVSGPRSLTRDLTGHGEGSTSN